MSKAASKKLDLSGTAAAPHRTPVKLLWWGGLCGGAVIILSPGTAVLLAALMMPVLAVALLPGDAGGDRVTLAASLFGLAGSIQGLFGFWQGDADLPAAVAMLRQPSILLTAWIGILGGWFVSECTTSGLRLLAELKAANDRRIITAAITTLEKEWGPLRPLSPAQS